MSETDPYLAERQLIERAIDFVCLRHRLSGPEGEDFASVVRIHLIEDDYAVLRAFEGRSSLRTYLITVITRQFQDWQNAKWGKWRPSAEARRCGPVALRLEQLLVRDGRPFEEAIEVLRTHHGVTESRDTLEAIAARLPIRWKKAFLPESALEDHPASDGPPDAGPIWTHTVVLADTMARALSQAILRLTGEDALILRMRFQDDVSVAEIARTLGLDPKRLYRRLTGILSVLRGALEEAGVGASAAADLLADRVLDRSKEEFECGEMRTRVRLFDHDSGSSPQPGRTE